MKFTISILLMVVAPCQAGSYEVCFSVYTIAFDFRDFFDFIPRNQSFSATIELLISYERVLFYKLLSTRSFIGLD